MPSKNSNVRKLRTQPKPQLTDAEVQRIAEKLAVALNHDTAEIALVTLLFDHLETLSQHGADLWSSLYMIKKYLFVGTGDMEEAQQQFQNNAYKNRANLLLWPSERSAS